MAKAKVTKAGSGSTAENLNEANYSPLYYTVSVWGVPEVSDEKYSAHS